MNIQQLNESGQQVWVFVVTAFISLAVTGALWYSVDSINDIKRWRNSLPAMDDKRFKRTKQYSIGLRFAMLYYLCRRGHVLWMIQSRFWFFVLANKRPSHDRHWVKSAPGEIVENYLRGEWKFERLVEEQRHW